MVSSALQQNVIVTCSHCGEISYYHDEREISASQLVLLSRRMCRCCAEIGAVVEVTQTPLPPGVRLQELPIQTSRRHV
jgi:hypothetical protein